MKMRLVPLLLLGTTFFVLLAINKQSVETQQKIIAEPVEPKQDINAEPAEISNQIDHQDYIKYFTTIKENEDFVNRFGDSENIRYYMACLDEDDIPEMLIANESIHPSQITIYRYDADKDDIYYLGKIGSNASLSYYLNKNYIICSYGNNGYFISVPYSIVDGQLQAGEGYADLNNIGPERFFRGIQPSENLEDESLDYYIDASSTEIEISEDEYNNYFYCEGEIETVYYDDMFPLE